MNEEKKYELQKLDDNAKQIYDRLDLDKPDQISNFGSELANEDVSMSIKSLDNIQNKNSGEIGKALINLSTTLKDLPSLKDQNKKYNLIDRLFHKTKMSSYQLQAKYQSGASTINSIKKELSENIQKLNDNNKDMEQVYNERTQYYNKLSSYIQAGEAKLKELDDKLLPKIADEIKNATDKDTRFNLEQKQNQLMSSRNILMGRVNDWRTSQALTYQQVNQLNLIASSNKKLISNTETIISTAIPAWYTQATNVMFQMQQEEIHQANKVVVDATNEMITESAKMTRDNTVDIIKDSQEPVIKAETLEDSYKYLLEAVKDSQEILRNSNKAEEEQRKRVLDATNKFHKELNDALKNDHTNTFKQIN